MASLLAAVSAAASSGAAGVAIAGVLGSVLLAAALLARSRALVAPAVGIIALAALGANTSSYALVPVESASLVTIALLAWWSIDEHVTVVGERSVDTGRAVTSAGLVLAAAGLSVLVIAMASVASSELVGPAVGAAGIVSIAAATWAVARLRHYDTEHRR